jgi:RHS repeat-associated protein
LSTDKKFTGQRLDSTGLYYYNARYYDATIGRFISPDTIVQNPANPQTLNRYSYGLNNPLKYTDPSGYWVNLGGDFIAEVQDAIANGDLWAWETGLRLYQEKYGRLAEAWYKLSTVRQALTNTLDYCPERIDLITGDIDTQGSETYNAGCVTITIDSSLSLMTEYLVGLLSEECYHAVVDIEAERRGTWFWDTWAEEAFGHALNWQVTTKLTKRPIERITGYNCIINIKPGMSIDYIDQVTACLGKDVNWLAAYPEYKYPPAPYNLELKDSLKVQFEKYWPY